MIDLRLGDWREVLAGVEEVDAVITDAPYDERTHAAAAAAAAAAARPEFADGNRRRNIPYAPWGKKEIVEFVELWSPRCCGWFVSITSHSLFPAWAEALADQGRYVFHPLPFVSPGSRVRLVGDGPSNWTCWVVVARPKTRRFASWGTLPGAYNGPPEPMDVVGGKPLWLMRAIVRDYTRTGDLIVDPCAGGGTTLLAAAIEGRRAIGAEIDPETHARAMRRLSRGYTPDMFSGAVA